MTGKQLRSSILQYAIQGKLVKQNLNDEPASKLIKDIYKEKQKLIFEDKLKKNKNESFIYKNSISLNFSTILFCSANGGRGIKKLLTSLAEILSFVEFFFLEITFWI